MPTAKYEEIETFLENRIENSANPRMYRETLLKLRHLKRARDKKEKEIQTLRYEKDRDN